MGCCGASRTKGPAVARTPLPRGPLAAVVLINMTAGFQMNIIFPFVPFMVEELRQTTVDTGFYVGLLAASYFAGQFVASFIWPPLSDKLGRKKLLLLGQLGLTVPFVCFGSATNYWVALAFRFLNGLCQQNWVISNAMLADITDSTNQAQGMAAGAFSWGLANILAPMVGGLLARPTVTLPEHFDGEGLFGRLPYLLPTLVVCVWGWLAALVGLFWLPPDKITWAEAVAKATNCSSEEEYTALSTTDDTDAGNGAGPGAFSQTYGSILTVIVHINTVPRCCISEPAQGDRAAVLPPDPQGARDPAGREHARAVAYGTRSV